MSGAEQGTTPRADAAQRVRMEAVRQWSKRPAGAAAADLPLGTAASFEAVEARRHLEQPWMQQTFRFERLREAHVLEIGVGLGTDHVRLGRAGAQLSGIDLTPRCVELTSRRCRLAGLQSSLAVMDAEELAYPDDTFDVVYSFGVLHHVPSAERAFREARRVLRPGGALLGAVYSRESLFWTRVLAERWLTLGFLREPLADVKARIEEGAEEARPYVRLFGSTELRRELGAAGFSHVALKRRHLGLPRLERRLPPKLVDALARRAGWYLVFEAR
jgi:SAM-dependent methyltransferase